MVEEVCLGAAAGCVAVGLWPSDDGGCADWYAVSAGYSASDVVGCGYGVVLRWSGEGSLKRMWGCWVWSVVVWYGVVLAVWLVSWVALGVGQIVCALDVSVIFDFDLCVTDVVESSCDCPVDHNLCPCVTMWWVC